jgi:hypothetical protein
MSFPVSDTTGWKDVVNSFWTRVGADRTLSHALGSSQRKIVCWNHSMGL